MKGIKKMQMMIAVFAIASMSVFADKIISVNDLPQQIRDTVAAAFPENQIQLAKADSREFEVTLDDGTEIGFYRNGEWKEIESYSGVPGMLLPDYVNSYVKENFPDATVYKAEKDRKNFEAELSNGTELYFSYDGNFLGKKIDKNFHSRHYR